MIAGIAAYVKLVRPEVRIVGVQTVDSNSMALSLSAGRPTPVDDVGLFADGTAIKLVGTETFRLAQLYVDEIIQVGCAPY
jgi:threonine dehydratase